MVTLKNGWSKSNVKKSIRKVFKNCVNSYVMLKHVINVVWTLKNYLVMLMHLKV